MPPKRRTWLWFVVALLLLLLSAGLLLLLAPEPTSSGEGVAYGDRDRILILATGELGWLALVFAIRRLFSRPGDGILARSGRFIGWVVVAAGVSLSAVGGFFVSSFLSSKVHGPHSSGTSDWDD